MNEVRELATAIHKKRCNWNHIDGCGWDYENWEKPGYARKRYLERAEKVLEEVDFDTAMKVMDHI